VLLTDSYTYCSYTHNGDCSFLNSTAICTACDPLIITKLPVITADAVCETLDVCCKLKGLIAMKHFMAAVTVKPSNSKDNKAFILCFIFM